MFGGGNGNYFRIRSRRDAERYLEDERARRPGRGGGRTAWIVLGIVLLAVLVAFVVSRFG